MGENDRLERWVSEQERVSKGVGPGCRGENEVDGIVKILMETRRRVGGGALYS